VPNETLVRRNTCDSCGEPAPVLELKIGDHPTPIKARWCEACEPVERLRLAREDRARRADLLLARSGGSGFRSWSLATYPDDELGRKAKASAAQWFESLHIHRDEDSGFEGFATGPNFLIFGPVGTGKTGLAWSLVRALCEEVVPAMQLNFRDYLWTVRAAFSENAPRDDRPHTVSVLALDDLGAERATDFAREELATLVERRTQRHLPLIVTSNYDPDELAARLGHDDRTVGERIVSRLVQDAHQLRLDGADRRLTQAFHPRTNDERSGR
jgi:DNA replication protein DnaC